MTNKLNKQNILLLGSKSASRQQLLRESGIPFAYVEQNADEAICEYGLSLDQIVAAIALQKMEHVVLPRGEREGDICFVLTCDTLSQDKDGTVHGKPADRADAIAKIKSARGGSYLSSAFYLDRRVWRDETWEIEKRISKCVSAEYLFAVPDTCIEAYLDNSIGLQTAQAISIEGYGAQFLEYVRGSYSTIVGLPMYELREALEELEFF